MAKKKNPEYKLIQKRSERWAVLGKDGKYINGEEKVKILLKEGKVKIDKPKFYHGRILFEDGSAPILDPVLWQGAKIRVLFPSMGSVSTDSDGYFGVYFTLEQYELLKTTKGKGHIAIPNYAGGNSGTARFVFPVSKLSLETKEAGVVKIPRPGPSKTVESQQDL